MGKSKFSSSSTLSSFFQSSFNALTSSLSTTAAPLSLQIQIFLIFPHLNILDLLLPVRFQGPITTTNGLCNPEPLATSVMDVAWVVLNPLPHRSPPPSRRSSGQQPSGRPKMIPPSSPIHLLPPLRANLAILQVLRTLLTPQHLISLSSIEPYPLSSPSKSFSHQMLSRCLLKCLIQPSQQQIFLKRMTKERI